MQTEFQTLRKRFSNIHVTRIKPFGKSSCLHQKNKKKQRVCSHFIFLSMLYNICVKLLYSNLVQRNKINSAPVCYYIKNKTIVFCFKLAIITSLCSSHNYLNRHSSDILKFENESSE